MQLSDAFDVGHATRLLQPHQLESQGVGFEIYPLGLDLEVVARVVIVLSNLVKC